MRVCYSLIVLILAASSCCKEVCPDESVTLHFKNFPGTDLNSIQLVSFQGGSGFSSPLDTITQEYAITQSTPQELRLTMEVNLERDIEIIIPAISVRYTVSELQVERVKCNCESGTYRRMKGYRLDNVVYAGDEVEISK